MPIILIRTHAYNFFPRGNGQMAIATMTTCYLSEHIFISCHAYGDVNRVHLNLFTACVMFDSTLDPTIAPMLCAGIPSEKEVCQGKHLNCCLQTNAAARHAL